jgi:dihydrofolate reductase
MRKIILNLAVSLDGFIEGPGGEYDWCFADQDYGMAEFLEQIDCLLMGRKSYQTLRESGSDSGADPFAGKHKYIVSSKLESVRTGETVITGDFKAAIARLKNEDGKGGNIWLFGGAQLTDALLQAKLVDEFQVSVHPLLLGAGTRLFRQLDSRVPLELAGCKQYDSGLVQLSYRCRW